MEELQLGAAVRPSGGSKGSNVPQTEVRVLTLPQISQNLV